MFLPQMLCLAIVGTLVCSIQGYNSHLRGSPSLIQEMVYDKDLRCAKITRRRLAATASDIKTWCDQAMQNPGAMKTPTGLKNAGLEELTKHTKENPLTLDYMHGGVALLGRQEFCLDKQMLKTRKVPIMDLGDSSASWEMVHTTEHQKQIS